MASRSRQPERRALHSLGAAATAEATLPEIEQRRRELEGGVLPVIKPALPELEIPATAPRAAQEIAQRAAAAVEQCGEAAAKACEDLADQVQASANTIIEYLRALAGDYRSRTGLAALSVTTFGADANRAFEALRDLRVEFDNSGPRSHG